MHCAGAFAFSPIVDAKGADLDRMLTVNARSAFPCSREAARRMRAAQRVGRIVNVVSRQALDRRGASMVPHTMSKAAVAALTVALAEELAPERVGVNAVAPSILDTPANRARPRPARLWHRPRRLCLLARLHSWEDTWMNRLDS